MEIDKESPSESVGADKLSAPTVTSSKREIVVSTPALGELLEGITGVGAELPPPPPPPQAATMKAIRLAEASLGFLRRLEGWAIICDTMSTILFLNLICC